MLMSSLKGFEEEKKRGLCGRGICVYVIVKKGVLCAVLCAAERVRVVVV
jgi:hypothetical protein